MANNITDRLLGGKLIWLPIGIPLVCLLFLCVLFVLGETWFTPSQLVTFGLWGSLLVLISVLWVGYLFFCFAKRQTWMEAGDTHSFASVPSG